MELVRNMKASKSIFNRFSKREIEMLPIDHEFNGLVDAYAALQERVLLNEDILGRVFQGLSLEGPYGLPPAAIARFGARLDLRCAFPSYS